MLSRPASRPKLLMRAARWLKPPSPRIASATKSVVMRLSTTPAYRRDEIAVVAIPSAPALSGRFTSCDVTHPCGPAIRKSSVKLLANDENVNGASSIASDRRVSDHRASPARRKSAELSLQAQRQALIRDSSAQDDIRSSQECGSSAAPENCVAGALHIAEQHYRRSKNPCAVTVFDACAIRFALRDDFLKFLVDSMRRWGL